MIFHENCLLADDSLEISYRIFSEKDVAKFVVCCSRDWRLRVKFFSMNKVNQDAIKVLFKKCFGSVLICVSVQGISPIYQKVI